MQNSDAERRQGFRGVIEAFLQERLGKKQKGQKQRDTEEEDAEKKVKKGRPIATQYEPEIWIANAALRVGKIHAATHTLKATHPHAKGSSVYCIPEPAGRENLVGSHQLSNAIVSDFVCNAADLDVYKFLRCEYEGKTLLTWMQEGDVELLEALHSDLAIARGWARALTDLYRLPESLSSHTHAKQMYWLVGDDPVEDEQYHLLSPLFSSSLTHTVFEIINEDCFGETVKETRKTRLAGVYNDKVRHDYPNLAVMKLGGTKPQNVSQLNNDRHGVNYLLASLPPIWQSSDVRPPLGIRPLFEQFGRRRDCAQLVKQLKAFLESDPAPTVKTRQLRDNLLEKIIGEVQQYADELRVLAPGWSTDSRCHLTDEEALWLDPARAGLDATFAEAWHQGHWKAEIQHRFGAWLNHALGEILPLGDIEHAFWADALNTESWQSQIDADRRAMEKKEASDACNS